MSRWSNTVRLKRLQWIIACLIAVLWACPMGLAAEEIPHLLFGAADLTARSLGPGVADLRTFVINPDALHVLSEDRTNKVAVQVADTNIVFQRVRHQRRKKTATWIGTAPKDDARILITIGPDHFFGRLILKNATFIYSPGSSPMQVQAQLLDPAFEVEPEFDAITPQSAAELPAEDTPPTAAVGDDGSVIDVMVLYTSGMAAAHPGTQIDTRIQYLIDVANDAYVRSAVNTQLNLVHSAEVNYTDDSPGIYVDPALDDLTENLGVFDGVEELRTTYGADQVTLLRRYVDEGCGLAWLLNGFNASFNSTYSYSVVHDGSKTDGSGWFCSDLSYAHELGHNLGCAHDIANSGNPGKYVYSYGYQHPSGAFRTIMAYSAGCTSPCPQIAYFSNPNISYNGQPTGIADAADNARTINQTRIEMAGYRTSVPEGTITVLSPNGYLYWYIGASVTISWSSENLTDNVSIELLRNGVVEYTITSSTPNDGSYSWTIPQSITGSSAYKIRISSTAAPTIYDASDSYFTITAPPESSGLEGAIFMLLFGDN